MRHCLIFGGSRGIGATIAKSLIQEEFSVTVASRNTHNVNRSIYGYEATEKVPLTSLVCDVRDEQAVRETVKASEDMHGVPAVVINAAGINKDSLLVKTSLGAMKELIDTNLIGTMLVCQAVIKGMLQSRDGCIINIGSVVGLHGNTGQCVYSASKSGLVGFTKSLAKEVGPRGIRVNLIAPGFIQTDMISQVKNISEVAASTPLQRIGQPEDVANLVRYLIGASISGQVLYVDGGLHLNM